MNTVIEVQGLYKEYALGKGNTQEVLKDISLTIEEGEFVSIMGPSGSGKSTLLYSISGMDQASSGSVSFCGKELTTMSEDHLSSLRLENMGFIFQQNQLLQNFNVYDNIVIPAYLKKHESRDNIRARADELLERTGMSAYKDKEVTQLSGGQQQRVAICRALINQPELVFGDEPTGALNSTSAMEVMDILNEINEEGTTILLVTHDPKIAARTKRVLFMSDGKLCDELTLGNFNAIDTDLKSREQRLSNWLMESGF